VEVAVGCYASETTVPVSKSRAEIEAVLIKYGASEFQSGWKSDAALIGFRMKDLFVRFILPIPVRTEKRFTHTTDRFGYTKKRTEQQAEKEYDQDIRQRWRALLLTIKAKLEAVECGISTVEQEFLAFIVMPNGVSIGDFVIERAMPAIRSGNMPLALQAPPEDRARMEDAEVTGSKPSAK
jgi:hypothetical protein